MPSKVLLKNIYGREPQDTNITHEHFPKIHPKTIITAITGEKLEKETYQLQPGVRDQHLVLFILGGEREKNQQREEEALDR